MSQSTVLLITKFVFISVVLYSVMKGELTENDAFDNL